jgi:outer membrane protein OmpA-like peptidoglycan-associated protein
MKANALSSVLFLCIASFILGYSALGHAQSNDVAHPTPAAPGLNKANIDNFGGPEFYYFYAGPGPIDVRIGFHEMGLFGNPLRQTLTVELADEKSKVFSQQLVTSQGNLASATLHTTLAGHQKVLLGVSAQKGTIRMGGYYEFEITGAVSLDGKGGSSANVKPEDTRLVKGQTVLINGQTSLTSGQTSLTSGTTSLTSGSPTSLTSGTQVTLVTPGQALTVVETPRELRLRLAADVLFDFGKADILPVAAATLRQAAAKIKNAKPRGAILVAGYTDSKGTPALNQQLSQRRAEAVETWLIQNASMSVSSMTPKGYGAAQPVAPNQKADGQDNPAGRQLNRRVEIVISK